MSIAIHWDDSEKTTLRYEVTGNWTWGELYRSMDEVYGHMDGAEHTEYVGTIIHFKDSRLNIPTDVMAHLGKVARRPHHKAGLTVLVGVNHFMRTMFETFASSYRMMGNDLSFHYADSLDKARSLIAADREKNRPS